MNKTTQGGWSLAGGLEACPTSRATTMNHSRVNPDSKAPDSNMQRRIKAHYPVLLDTPVISRWWQEPCGLGDLLKRSYSGRGGGSHRGTLQLARTSQRHLHNTYRRGEGTSHQCYQVFITAGQRDHEPPPKPQEKKNRLGSTQDSSPPTFLACVCAAAAAGAIT